MKSLKLGASMTASSDDALTKLGFGNILGSRMDIPKAEGARVRLDILCFFSDYLSVGYSAVQCTTGVCFGKPSWLSKTLYDIANHV